MEQKEVIKPNVFLVGVQKSATTSVYDWVAQHPDVCGPVSMKDTPFFIDDQLFKKGYDFLSKIYAPSYSGQRLVINGSAHNIYFEHALERIHKLNTDAKIILVLRNPVDRAISAYNFAVKRNLEKDDFPTAIEKEHERLQSDNIQILSETTYIDHGLYSKQITTLLKYYPQKNIKILLYERVREFPEQVIAELYQFLDIDSDFVPELRKLNVTGETRFRIIKNLIYNNSKTKTFLIKNGLDKLLSYDQKYRLKIFFLKFITKKGKVEQKKLSLETRKRILEMFLKDIEQLEKITELNLSHWKSIEE